MSPAIFNFTYSSNSNDPFLLCRADMRFQMDGGKWTQILTSKFFGANDPLTGEIIDGRWKSQTIPYVTKEFLISEGIDPVHTFFPSDESIWYVKSS
jgi:hypothetical protein